MNDLGDLFDGWFDDRDRGYRVQITSGVIRKECRKNCCGYYSPWAKETLFPWGHFPDLPANSSKAA